MSGHYTSYLNRKIYTWSSEILCARLCPIGTELFFTGRNWKKKCPCGTIHISRSNTKTYQLSSFDRLSMKLYLPTTSTRWPPWIRPEKAAGIRPFFREKSEKTNKLPKKGVKDGHNFKKYVYLMMKDTEGSISGSFVVKVFFLTPFVRATVAMSTVNTYIER